MPPAPFRRARLLLVEDDRMVRETLILMLEETYAVHIAASVGPALDYLRAPKAPEVDLILLDCLLPGGNLSDLLAEADRREIPVVLISGDPQQSEKVDPNRAFLPKPFTQSTLLAILDSTRR